MLHSELVFMIVLVLQSFLAVYKVSTSLFQVYQYISVFYQTFYVCEVYLHVPVYVAPFPVMYLDVPTYSSLHMNY